MTARARCVLLVLLCSIACAPAAAQFSEGGARSVALGGATTALAGDVWGHANPATWSPLSERAASLFASEAFGLAELRLGALALAQPTRFGTLAAGARTFGFEAYRETHFYGGFARAFRFGSTRPFHLGMQVRSYRVAIDGYGTAGAVGLTFGGLVSILPTLQAGGQVVNLNRPSLDGQVDLPRSLSLGLSYQAGPRVLLLLDALDDVRYPLAIRGGVEVLPVAALALRAGFTSEPARYTAGLGLHLGPLTADLSAERHETLGWSPAVTLTLFW